MADKRTDVEARCQWARIATRADRSIHRGPIQFRTDKNQVLCKLARIRKRFWAAKLPCFAQDADRPADDAPIGRLSEQPAGSRDGSNTAFARLDGRLFGHEVPVMAREWLSSDGVRPMSTNAKKHRLTFSVRENLRR